LRWSSYGAAAPPFTVREAMVVLSSSTISPLWTLVPLMSFVPSFYPDKRNFDPKFGTIFASGIRE
jgi:hypothetical protein